MKVCDKLACSFQNWYPKFKRWTVRSEIVDVPSDVLAYLRSDIVMVPAEALFETVKTSDIDDITYSIWEDSDGDEEDESEPSPPRFPEFSKRLKEAVARLGGQVFVKMNWSAPTDAAWIATNNSLKCSNLQDLYLLLKGSDRISKDLDCDLPSKDLEYCIVLRKWEDIHPGSEFRCFVSDGELIAITQRNKTEYHEHIPQYKCEIVNDIKQFFDSKIKNNFILNNFIFDVVWNISKTKLVDFSPLNEKEGDSYLFTWPELREMSFVDGVSPEFRFIGEDVGIQPANLSRHFGIPRDLTELSEGVSRSIIEMIQNNIDLQTGETE